MGLVRDVAKLALNVSDRATPFHASVGGNAPIRGPYVLFVHHPVSKMCAELFMRHRTSPSVVLTMNLN